MVIRHLTFHIRYNKIADSDGRPGGDEDVNYQERYAILSCSWVISVAYNHNMFTFM